MGANFGTKTPSHCAWLPHIVDLVLNGFLPFGVNQLFADENATLSTRNPCPTMMLLFSKAKAKPPKTHPS